MIECVHIGGGPIRALDMHIQVECRAIYEVTPSSTSMSELSPRKSVVPFNPVFIQSIEIEYDEEYVIVERIYICVKHGVTRSLGCRRWGQVLHRSLRAVPE